MIGLNKSKTVAVNSISTVGYFNATPMGMIEELLTKWCEVNGIKL